MKAAENTFSFPRLPKPADFELVRRNWKTACSPNWKRNFPSISTSLNFPLFFWQLSFSYLYIFILFFLQLFNFPPRNYQGLNYFWLTPSRKSRFQGLLICQNKNIYPAAFRESFAAYEFSFSPVLILLQHKNWRSSIRYKRPVCSSLHLQSTRMLFLCWYSKGKIWPSLPPLDTLFPFS